MISRLPLLEPARETLEKCVYCPKLCRAACPVSNHEPRETLTPWGKMSSAYFLGRGDIPIDREHAAPAWACAACYGCRERCDHKNDVATTLLDARAELHARGAAPAEAARAASRQDDLSNRAQQAAATITRRGGAKPPAAGLLVGCGYLLHAPDVAADAARVTEALLRGAPRVLGRCCGLVSLLAGDRPGFVRAAQAFARDASSADPLVVVDPGCATTLLVEYPRAGISVRPPRLFVDLAEEHIDRFQARERRRPRYHDPCQLGRGLGKYDGPRRLLARVAGAPPLEFERARERADCSGGGGLLPLTYPEASHGAATARIEEHRRLGGGPLVTGCASSLRRFRSAGEDAEDLTSWLARGLVQP